jgi:CDP-diglyceride synthetase
MQTLSILHSVVLLILANGTPVLAKKAFGTRYAFPLDAGLLFLDGRPIFGSSKTIRGILTSLAITTVAAPMLGLDLETGALVAVVAMAGDLFSSFVKRRLNFPPSSQAVGLDQVPESLFPLLACRHMLSLAFTDVFIAVGLFFVGELVISRVLYALRLRDEPY